MKLSSSKIIVSIAVRFRGCGYPEKALKIPFWVQDLHLADSNSSMNQDNALTTHCT